MYSAHKKKKLLSSGVFLISFLVTFAIFVERLEFRKLVGFDLTIIRHIQSKIDTRNTRLMRVFTFLGSPFVICVLVALSVIGFYRSGRKRAATCMLIANAAGVGFNEGLKFIFRRRRPDIHRLIPAHGYSFPSGHSMGSVMFYGTLSYLLCQHMKSYVCRAFTCVFSAFMVFMTGLSRIYLGVHYPSDVISGYAAGGAWLSATIKGFSAIHPKRR